MPFDYTVSPDADDVLLAISIIKGGSSIVPENLDAAVAHTISELGGHAIHLCAGKPLEFKRGFIIGWAECMRNK